MSFVLIFKIFILELIKGILDLIVCDILPETNLFSKVHYDNVIFSFSQELFGFPIRLDHLNALVISSQNIFLKADGLSQLPDF